MPILLYFLAAFLLLLIFRNTIRFFIVDILRRFLKLDGVDLRSAIIPAVKSMIKYNWYTILFLVVLWYILFRTEVGKDMIESYNIGLSTSGVSEFNQLGFLFLCVFIFSWSLWVIPFFLFSNKAVQDITGCNAQGEMISTQPAISFYVATKVIAIIAMFPFFIVTNALLFSGQDTRFSSTGILAINVVFILLFFGVSFLINELLNKFLFTRRLQPLLLRIRKFKEQYFRNNYYAFMIAAIMLSVLFVTIVFAMLMRATSQPDVLVAPYMFVASNIVFVFMLFGGNRRKISSQTICRQVRGYFTSHNRKHSYAVYFIMCCLLCSIILFYYVAKSLLPINTLFILVICLSFFTAYFDFLYYVITNYKGWKRWAAFSALVGFIILPFLNAPGQFVIGLKSYTPPVQKLDLESALYHRYLKADSTRPVYIITSMGGGSRAGYITAGVLHEINKADPAFWGQVLCISTVSGGSVGTFTYNRSKGYVKAADYRQFLEKIYAQDYNSSGVFNFLIGDSFERFFGVLVSGPKKIISNASSEFGYIDRNERIRTEYNLAMQDALYKQQPGGTLRWNDQVNPMLNVGFKDFFRDHYQEFPIHLINTFEVNSGRRAVLCPLPINDSASIFPNTVLPMQDTAFDDAIANKQITYREASNLSELFPIISAASQIGMQSPMQFVDGGYFENYGISAAIDVYNLFQRRIKLGLLPAKPIRILVIKNSKQEPTEPSTNFQLIAPLVGVTKAPFTGHANQLLAEAGRITQGTPGSGVYTLVFDGDKYKVPLTRSLHHRHTQTMDRFLDKVMSDTLRKFLSLPKLN